MAMPPMVTTAEPEPEDRDTTTCLEVQEEGEQEAPAVHKASGLVAKEPRRSLGRGKSSWISCVATTGG